jgi:hypothetical protein
LLSVCAGLYVVPLYAQLQQNAPPERRARIMAASNLTNAGGMVLASLSAMALFALGGNIVDLFLCLGLTTFLVGCVIPGKNIK